MARKKQRRRREKGRRHEYEYVYVDEEGREVDVTDEDGDAPKAQKAPAAARQTRTARGRPVRKVDPPSWRKVLRRGAIFAPVMFIVVYLLRSKSMSIAAVFYQTALLMAFFIPFSYLMDRMMYRTYLRRSGQEPPRQQTRR